MVVGWGDHWWLGLQGWVSLESLLCIWVEEPGVLPEISISFTIKRLLISHSEVIGMKRF